MYYLPLLLFLDEGFKFQVDIRNKCHDTLMMPMNLSNIATLYIHGVDLSLYY